MDEDGRGFVFGVFQDEVFGQLCQFMVYVGQAGQVSRLGGFGGGGVGFGLGAAGAFCFLVEQGGGFAAEVGELFAFLGSDESSYITGAQVVIDGAATLPETNSMGTN